jgi:hypothetical protein
MYPTHPVFILEAFSCIYFKRNKGKKLEKTMKGATGIVGQGTSLKKSEGEKISAFSRDPEMRDNVEMLEQ